MIDHIDRNKTNNKLENLRLVSAVLNRRNSSIRQKNKSGVTGVHWSKQSKKWCAQITPYKTKIVHLGFFESKQDAILARKIAEKNFY